MIVHPQELSDQMLYAVDQHVMKGGQAIVFLDPNADSLVTRSPQVRSFPRGWVRPRSVVVAWGSSIRTTKSWRIMSWLCV